MIPILYKSIVEKQVQIVFGKEYKGHNSVVYFENGSTFLYEDILYEYYGGIDKFKINSGQLNPNYYVFTQSIILENLISLIENKQKQNNNHIDWLEIYDTQKYNLFYGYKIQELYQEHIKLNTYPKKEIILEEKQILFGTNHDHINGSLKNIPILKRIPNEEELNKIYISYLEDVEEMWDINYVEEKLGIPEINEDEFINIINSIKEYQNKDHSDMLFSLFLSYRYNSIQKYVKEMFKALINSGFNSTPNLYPHDMMNNKLDVNNFEYTLNYWRNK